MKPIINLSLLLISLQVRCQQLPEHHDYQEDHEDKTPSEHHHLASAEEQELASPDYHKIVSSNADFAFRLYRNIASDAAAKNIFFSPFSICTAFALLTLGAKSETKGEIYKGLAFNLLEIKEKEIHEGFRQLMHMLHQTDSKALVNLGNALFMDQSLKFLPTFLEDAKAFYEAEGFSVDFNASRVAKKLINDYVQNKTHGKISHALDELNPGTVMLLVNYLFFKASWKNPFDTHLIREKTFFVDANTTVKVNMMHRKGYYKYLHDEELSCWVVELPYKSNAVAFFILPENGKLEHAEIVTQCHVARHLFKDSLFIPKLSITASYDIKTVLQRMGMTAIFNDSADLSGITGQRNLKVSKALHHIMLDMNESGTEVAAVTTIEFMLRSASPHPLLVLNFNRPFLIIIWHTQTDNILFMGKILNPTKK
uniref:Serpin domain-containing protein n=1 Tax=Varanus komodoensis TaxID=61221 RepID=A0A8D2J4A6_VARKO